MRHTRTVSASFLGVLLLVAVGADVSNALPLTSPVAADLPSPPPLPPAGATVRDPVFGTEILRVTDRADGEQADHAYSLWSPFNADDSRFLVRVDRQWTLYEFDRKRFSIKKEGPVCCPSGGPGLDLSTAQWDPRNPDILYALEPSRTGRRLFAYDVAAKRYSLLHDFTRDVPTGGYPNSLSMSEDGRRFAFYASRTGGQDTGQIAVAYDRLTGRTFTYDLGRQYGVHDIHSAFIDKGGDYVVLRSATVAAGKPSLWVWNVTGGAMTPLLWNEKDRPGGHSALGRGVMISQDIWQGKDLLVRSLAHPHEWRAMPVSPGILWETGSHFSWNQTDDRSFIWSTYTASPPLSGWRPYRGAIYQLTGFTKVALDPLPPQAIRLNGVNLTEHGGLPAAPGQWAYNQQTDTLYVWLPHNADPNAPANVLVPVAAGRPYLDQIMRGLIDQSGDLTQVQQLAHTFSTWPNTIGYLDQPRASIDRNGQFVLFTSNWGGSGHRDVFLFQISPTSSGASRFALESLGDRQALGAGLGDPAPLVVTPEPGTLLLVASGLVGLAARTQRPRSSPRSQGPSEPTQDPEEP